MPLRRAGHSASPARRIRMPASAPLGRTSARRAPGTPADHRTAAWAAAPRAGHSRDPGSHTACLPASSTASSTCPASLTGDVPAALARRLRHRLLLAFLAAHPNLVTRCHHCSAPCITRNPRGAQEPAGRARESDARLRGTVRRGGGPSSGAGRHSSGSARLRDARPDGTGPCRARHEDRGERQGDLRSVDGATRGRGAVHRREQSLPRPAQ